MLKASERDIFTGEKLLNVLKQETASQQAYCLALHITMIYWSIDIREATNIAAFATCGGW